MTEVHEAISRVVRCLTSYKLDASNEDTMQRAVASALDLGGFRYERECRLNAKDRIDFLTVDGIGLELKVDGGANEVARQLIRYAECDQVRGLVLITTRSKHGRLPSTLLHKPLTVYLQGGLG